MSTCLQCKIDFEPAPEDQKFYEQIGVPAPKQCPECRLIRRLQERNGRKLYKRKCDFSGKTILSTYHENQPFPVYHYETWWGDEWDALSYGREVDFNRPFFEQFAELLNQVPHLSLFVIGGTLENSEYTNCTGYLKNCYLVSESDYSEDCAFSNRIYHCKNVLDCTNCYECELAYECIDCQKSYNLKFSQECTGCQDGFFLKSCVSCKDCIASVNQRHKQYMIFNKQLSKEEYEQEKAKMKLNTPEGIAELRHRAEAFFLTQPRKATEGENNENVLGDHLYNSKNAFHCFDSKDLEDCRYCIKVALHAKNCMDYTSWGCKAELIYHSAGCGDNAYNLKFCSTCTTNNSNLEYCFQVTGCSDCFGCTGLKKKRFCIFNKQYSEADYHILRAKLIEHMKQTGEYGEFFPVELNPYGYNETLVMDHFPLTREEALAKGYKWSDYEMPAPADTNVPDTIRCEVTGKVYKLTPQELAFYKNMDLPLPKRHPDQRHADRMLKRPEYRLQEVACTHCGQTVPSATTSQNSQSILCPACYLKVVY
ncbi:MAG: hypothetical protein WC777_00180 [Candidatus Gracilibacteria bacterium]|jgi:hypothetical protein